MRTREEIRRRITTLEKARYEAMQRAHHRTDGSSVWHFQLARHHQGAIEALEWAIESKQAIAILERLDRSALQYIDQLKEVMEEAVEYDPT